MRWSRIKNIIILLLVIVNAFLLAQVGLREWQSRRGQRETRERMIAILAQNDVAYLPEEIPGELELSLRRVTATPFGQTEAQVLVGAVADVQRVGGHTVYTGAEGTLTAAAGELTVEYLPGAAPSEGTVLERLSKLNVSLRREGPANGEGESTARYEQLWDGVPIPGETVELSLSGDTVSAMTFRLLVGTEELLPVEETVTASTALMRLLDELSRGEGYVCSQITDMYPGYVAGGTGPVTLTPAWFIETDTWRFIVDGRTGQVTATE